MAFYNLKIPVNCANDAEAAQLQAKLTNFRLFTASMVVGLIQLQSKNPKLVKTVLSSAANGNIGGAMAGIMKAM